MSDCFRKEDQIRLEFLDRDRREIGGVGGGGKREREREREREVVCSVPVEYHMVAGWRHAMWIRFSPAAMDEARQS